MPSPTAEGVQSLISLIAYLPLLVLLVIFLAASYDSYICQKRANESSVRIAKMEKELSNAD